MKSRLLLCLAFAFLLAAGPARADGDQSSDSLTAVGEFVDPVCFYQHGMLGTLQQKCALVPGRIEQGMEFYDLRARRLYTVIGATHWDNPREQFLDALGETLVIRARVWRRANAGGLVITSMRPLAGAEAPPFRWWPWSWHLSVLIGCAVLALAYAWLARRTRAAADPAARVGRRHAIAFAAALAVMLVSLNGPVHDLSDQSLFSVHMAQHLFLALEFAPLFLLALPAAWWPSASGRDPLARTVRAFTRVPVGALLYLVTFSIWHVPAFYNLMMRDHDIHIVMHLLVMATAVLMWWPLLAPASTGARLAPAPRMAYLVFLALPSMLLGAYLAAAGRPLYEWYALAPRLWGMSALADQKLGGFLMAVPGGIVYWVLLWRTYRAWAASMEPAPAVAAGAAPSALGRRGP